MSGLSYTALNALRGGYGGSDPDLEAIYGLGLQTGQNALSTKQLEEKLKLERQKLATGFIGEGWGTGRQAQTALQDITGYSLRSPGGLWSPADVRNVSNLANLLNMRRFAGDQESLERYFNAGGAGPWSNYASGIGGLINKATSRGGGGGISANIGSLARKQLSI